MSGVTIQCLMCEKKVTVKGMLRHIHKHVDYFPQKCTSPNCHFESIHREELDQHTFDLNHVGGQSIDVYKQWLVDSINDDTQFAARHGMEQLQKRKSLAPSMLPFSPPTRPSLPSSSRSSRQPPPPRSDSPPVLLSSSDDDDEPPQKTTRQQPPQVARRSDNKPTTKLARKQREDSDEDVSESEGGDDKELVRLRKKFAKNRPNCALCGQQCSFSLADRQAHVLDKHFDDVATSLSLSDYREQLEEKTSAAFPLLVWNYKQCAVCPNMKSLMSHNGRQSHVLTAHDYLLKKLNCPKSGCKWAGIDPKDFGKHFVDKHAMLSSSVKTWKLFLLPQERHFEAAFEKHKSYLEAAIKLLFTVDIPEEVLLNGKSKRRPDDDLDEDLSGLSELSVAAPSRPLPAHQAAPKRRRSKSVSSNRGEEEDGDKATIPQSTPGFPGRRRPVLLPTPPTDRMWVGGSEWSTSGRGRGRGRGGFASGAGNGHRRAVEDR